MLQLKSKKLAALSPSISSLAMYPLIPMSGTSTNRLLVPLTCSPTALRINVTLAWPILVNPRLTVYSAGNSSGRNLKRIPVLDKARAKYFHLLRHHGDLCRIIGRWAPYAVCTFADRLRSCQGTLPSFVKYDRRTAPGLIVQSWSIATISGISPSSVPALSGGNLNVRLLSHGSRQ